MVDPSIKDSIAVFGPFLAAFFSGLIGVVVGHFLAKDKFKFEKLHTERIEIIRNLYRLLVKLTRATNEIVTHGTIPDLISKSGGNIQSDPLFKDVLLEQKIQKMQEFCLVYKEFNDFYSGNRIFLDDKIVGEIDELNRAAFAISSFSEISINVFKHKREIFPGFDTVFDGMKDKMSKITLIETQLKSLLGVTGK